MRPAGDSAPAPGPDPEAVPTASASPYVEGVHLQRTDENVREIAALAAVLGEPAGLDGVLG
ncbi:MAG TPA: hypothetical protein VEW73_02190, partial [Nocardioides sp.]|nr:hypothetical protein [Nocardioides sp.]